MAEVSEEEIARLSGLIADALEGGEASTSYDGNGFWVCLSGFLVFFMHAGFAMLEAGSVQDKNKVNILFKNVGTVTFGGVAYFLLGYGLAYGSADNNSFGGTSKFAGTDFVQSGGAVEGNDRRDFFFQYAFCVTAATITSGAVAGRIKLEAYFLLATLLTALVYPVISNWAWSSTGWMSAFKSDNPEDYFLGNVYENACGVFDYAGSGVVHLTGGVSAFWAATILGPRYGRFDAQYPKGVRPMPGHNLSIATLGTLILWFGWYGFNCGSALAFDGINVSKVAITTSLAPASACITSILVQKYRTGKYDLPGALNAILAGLVSITAGCSTVSDYAAIVIGAIGALIYIWAAEWLLWMKIDDPIGAVPVHGFCGIWGVLAIGIFSTPEFVQQAYSCPNPPQQSPSGDWLDVLPGFQMLTQIVFVLAIIGWVTITVAPSVYAMKKFGILRVPDHEQELGLDASEHFAKEQPHEIVVKKEVDVDEKGEAVEVKEAQELEVADEPAEVEAAAEAEKEEAAEEAEKTQAKVESQGSVKTSL